MCLLCLSTVSEQDPDNLLKGNGNEGITVCLLERGHPGLRLGDRHDPSASRYGGTHRMFIVWCIVVS